MNPQNPLARIQPEKRKQITRDLHAMSDDELFDDMQKCRAMARHPFATTIDSEEFAARIFLAKRILSNRFSEALRALPDA